jgi:uncharacterized protein
MKLYPSKYNYYYKLDSNYTFLNNFLTGALDLIESKIWEDLLGSDFSRVDLDPLSDLMERGYLYKDPSEEEKLFQKLFNNYKKKAIERTIKYLICPTYTCNLRCTYCFEKDLPDKPHKDMDHAMLEQALTSIEAVSRELNKKIDAVELFGGEPILPRNKDIVNKILKFAAGNRSKITIVTNGVFAGDFVDILNPVKENIEMLQITLDGPSEIHDRRRKTPSGKGSFDKISESISRLLEAGINTNARVNIDSDNIQYLPELYEFMKDRDWIGHPNFRSKPSLVTDHATLEYVDPIIPEDKFLDKLIDIYDENPGLEKTFGFYSFKPIRHIIDVLSGAPNVSPRYFNCESNLLELYIFCPDGLIYTCPESIGNEAFSIGKFSPDLKLSEKKMDLWRKRDIMNMEKCRSCSFAPICGGGCPFSSHLISEGREPVCERFREVLDTFLKRRGSMIVEKFTSS